MPEWKRTIAKWLGIELDTENHDIVPSRAANSTDISYIESEPTIDEWIHEHLPTPTELRQFVSSLFPFLQWIGNYNLLWLAGDLVAGITVGFVVVPQGMAYALLAQLPPEYGLYSSFVGVMLYWAFATSKDITIGPVAVMSTLVGNIVTETVKTFPEYTKPEVASAIALICGAIVFIIGFLRLGFVVDYIPLPAIAAFMTGSALNIAMGQIPSLMGIPSNIVDNRQATYRIFVDFWKHIGATKFDAVVGLTALFMLYAIRSIASNFGEKSPSLKRTLFFVSTMRTVFTILLYTLISWLVNRGREEPLFRILKDVPVGFQHMGVPKVDATIVKSFLPQLPAAVVVLLIEHIAISKSFGRINGYHINPSQELIAIGVTNIFGPFFGAYPATGSFSRTAIKAKAGVRTPLAGVVTGIVVLLAIYFLTGVFYYIPHASLAAVIIHAVGDLITSPNTIYRFWRVSPLEVFIFFAGVIVAIFGTIEHGIYTTVALSAILLLFRVAKAKGHFLGRVRVQIVPASSIRPPLRRSYGSTGQDGSDSRRSSQSSQSETKSLGRSSISSTNESTNYRDVFLPINRADGTNPEIKIDSPVPGVFIYRFTEGYTYPNAAHYCVQLIDFVERKCKRTSSTGYDRLGDRPWNDSGPRRRDLRLDEDERPTLKSIILDFSAVNHVDITSIQTLIDTRNSLDRYAAPTVVNWHFASVTNRWTKRALISAGFGSPTDDIVNGGSWKPLFSVADVGGDDELPKKNAADLESVPFAGAEIDGQRRRVSVHSVRRPMFHVDINAALQVVLENL